MVKNKLVQPFIKWAGGKRYLLPEISKRMPPKFNVYHEPFIGGGAVFFSIQPKNAIINDLNCEVINLYKVIKSDVDSLLKELRKHKNEVDYFYKIRELDRFPDKFNKLNDIEKAARILFLNKTCFNGLFRVNSQGQFNSPFGRYENPNFANGEVLKAVSNFLNDNDITILNKSFEELLPLIKKDLLYI
jgi:DNA adenine methylase